MEGADAGLDGAPGELTFRRYRRFAAGGAGLIWFEAAAVVEAGRSNAHQLLVRPANLAAFKNLVAETRAAAARTKGPGPILVLQLTHAGRFAKRDGIPAPVAAQRNPQLDPLRKTDGEFPLITDADLDRLQAEFVEAAAIAVEAGFDGVDIKACHGYLVGELLAAGARPDSRYGGPLENRARFLLETADRIKKRLPASLLAVRLGVCDGLPSPHGFGGSADNPERPDLAEAAFVVRGLQDRGLDLLNVTLGIPAYKAHFGRPFDRPAGGGPVPAEHPLAGIDRLIHAAAAVQGQFPKLPVVGTGYSWLRKYFPNVAAAAIAAGWISFAGVGRLAFAYPDFAADLRDKGSLGPHKACVACSHCSELLRAGRPVGCVVRDGGVYRAGKW
jgi:2,4-dienoyl-CoA reductase-like NADH-dependent reductase (Old Yellow Enzyme family)